MTSEGIFEQVRLFLPKYLSRERQDELWAELRAFPNNRTIYSDRNAEAGLLQGDAWRGFIAIDFESLERKTVSGLVLSNSCDISFDNPRALPANITFVPLVRLSAYVDALEEAGQTTEQRNSFVEGMRRQRITSLMYLPAVHDAMPESIALFHDVRAHPLADFRGRERSQIFRLSDFGFYLFLFKLSIHFTRMQEGLER